MRITAKRLRQLPACLGCRVRLIEYRLVNEDSEVRHNHEIGNPEFDEFGRYLGHLGTTQDITERKAAEDALNIAMGELRKTHVALTSAKVETDNANQSKSDFLANMSHKPRPPLNSIIGFFEQVQAESPGPIGSSGYLEYVGHIHDSGIQLPAIVNDIEDISKIEA